MQLRKTTTLKPGQRSGKASRGQKGSFAFRRDWYVPAVAVTSMTSPRTIHDFGGFPKELFEVQYPAPGSPELAARVIGLLGPHVIADETYWGLDHGTWSVMCHVFPDADVPVVQLSIDERQPPEFHYEVGRMLGALLRRRHSDRRKRKPCAQLAHIRLGQTRSRTVRLGPPF